MDCCDEAEKKERTAAMIALTEEDLMRLTVIQVDHDAQEALAFIQERMLPEIQRQQHSRMKGPLDGGTGGGRSGSSRRPLSS